MKMKNLCTLVLILVCTSWSNAQTVRYVKQGGAGTGTSWANASGDIQAMINASASGDEVRVAAGTYKPNRLMNNTASIYTGSVATELRKRAFVLKAGVSMKGGYPSNAAIGNDSWRPLDNKTILSGDFNSDDGIVTSTVTLSNNTDNAYSVVVISGSANQTFSITGFHITGGNANVAGSIIVNSNSLSTNEGGGISIVGSGMNVSAAPSISTVDHPKVYITSCVLYRNYGFRGGAIRAKSKALLFVKNSLFYENLAAYGAGICTNEYVNNIDNNTFHKNRASTAGGGIWAEKMSTVDNTNIVRVSIFDNIFDQNIQGVSDMNANGSDFSFGTATDTKLYSISMGVNRVGSIQPQAPTTNSYAQIGSLMTDAPLFVNAGAYNFRLNLFSKLVGIFGITSSTELDLAGNPRYIMYKDLGALETGFFPDANGVLYVRKGAQGTGSSWSDAMGELSDALEFIQRTNGNSYVNGISEVWISEGTYKPTFGPVDPVPGYPGEFFQGYDPTHTNVRFVMSLNTKLYGGFPATGNPVKSDRNWNTYKSILSGDLNGNDNFSGFGSSLVLGNRSDNAKHVMIAFGNYGECILDGVVIKGGNATLQETELFPTPEGYSTTAFGGNGGGLIIEQDDYFSPAISTNFQIRNTVFEQNYAIGTGPGYTDNGGGAVFISSSIGDINFVNCSFNSNLSGNNGGAVLIDNTTTIANVTFLNSTFAGNRASGSGGALYATVYNSGTLKIDNSIILGNSAVAGSEGISGNFSRSYSLVEGMTTTTLGNVSSLGLTTTNVFESIAPASAGYLRILNGSVPKNTANSALYNTALNGTLDLGGKSRIVGVLDMGAFENQCNTSVPTTANTTQQFCTSATVANLSATGTAVKWYAAATGGTALASTTSLVNGSIYYATQTISGCESETRLAVTVNITTTSVPTTANTTQQFCTSATVANLSATGTNIKWYAAATGGTALASTTSLVNGSIYYATQTVNGCESATRLAVTANITTTIAPTTANTTQQFCTSATISNLSATGTTIKWYAAATGGTALASTTSLVNGSIYYATQTVNGCESETRLAVTANITTTIAPTTANTTQQFCTSATVANLSATGTTIQWYAAATGGTALTSTTSLVNGSIYYATQTLSGCESAIRLAVTANITTTSVPTTANTTQQFCTSATIANLSATGTNIKWYATATGGTVLPTTTALANGSIYYATQTVNGCESTSRLAVTANITVASAPTTANIIQQFCSSATIANLSATGTTIKWYANLSAGIELPSTTSLVNGSIYYATQTVNGCESETRLAVTANITTTIAPTTANTTQQFCTSATVANLSATGTIIQWYAAATGGTALTSTTSLVNGSIYYATQTVNGCESATRLAVTANITTTSVPTTANTTQQFCTSATIANLSATGTTIKWYATATGGTVLPTTTSLANGSIYYATQTVNGCESATRLAVTANVTVASVPTTANTIQQFCTSATIANLSATGTAIKWYAAASGGMELASTTSLVNGSIYYATQTVNGCESTSRLAVTVNLTTTVAPNTSNPAQQFCGGATINDLVINGSAIAWYVSATGGTELASTTLLTDGTIYYATQTVNGCESASRLAVTANITTTAAPSTTNTMQQFCSSATIADLTVSGTLIKWYTTISGGTELMSTTTLTDGTTYYASQTENGCESMSRLSILVNVTITPAPTTANLSQTFLIGDNPTVGDLVATGTNVQWYSSVSGGLPISVGTALQDGATYYATQTINGCESAVRLAVTVSITLLSVEENVKVSFEVYPNPTSSALNILAGTEILSIQVFDASGKLIFDEKQNAKEVKLDVSMYPQAFYHLKVVMENSEEVIQFIKN